VPAQPGRPSERRQVHQLDHRAVLDRWNAPATDTRRALAGLLNMHSQNTIVAFLQAQELDLGKSNQ
jgi:hypothetical protein